MTRGSSTKASWDLLEGPAVVDGFGGSHALFERPYLELVGSHKGLKIQLAIFERSIGRLSGNAAGDMDFGALLDEGVAAGIGRGGFCFPLPVCLPGRVSSWSTRPHGGILIQ